MDVTTHCISYFLTQRARERQERQEEGVVLYVESSG